MELACVFDDYPSSLFVVEPIMDGMVSRDFVYIYVNDAFCLFLGRSRVELVGHRFLEVFADPGEHVWFDLFRDAAIYGKYRQVSDVSTVIGKHLLAEAFHVGPNRCCCIIRDFVTLDGAEDAPDEADAMQLSGTELARRAYVDYLTGFYNRFYLQEKSKEIAGMTNVGMTYLDINNLKMINDTLGHHAGDVLIQDFSKKLRELYPRSEIFRMGGDEFLVISPDVTEESFLARSAGVQKFFSEGRMSTAMGFRFCKSVVGLWEEIDACDALMYQNKRAMKEAN